MEYVIFGAGNNGREAMLFLGLDRVSFFIDNYKFGEKVNDIPIYDFEYYSNYTEDNILVIASANNESEMLTQIKRAGIKRYIVFRREHMYELPFYVLYNRYIIMTLTEVLAYENINEYKKIALIGSSYIVSYVIAEIAFQSDIENIIGVVKLDCDEYAEQNMGVNNITLEDAMSMADCIIVCDKREHDCLIREELQNISKIKTIDIREGYRNLPFFKHPELKKYKDIHKGKRAFLVGNGPSLTLEDLNILHENNELCFGTNKIYELYGKTKWRADYICISDHGVMDRALTDPEFMKVEGTVFWGDDYKSLKKDNIEKIHLVQESFYPNYPRFSDDIVQGTYAGNTVIYDLAFQLALYMGVSEIYLIGVDHNYSFDATEKENHFEGYTYTEKEKRMENVKKRYLDTRQMVHRMGKAFEKAKIHCENRGVKVFNATRGGKLEVFERVNFDGLFRGSANHDGV